MPGNLGHVGATLMCPHGGRISVVPGSARVKLGGQQAATQADSYLVSGCPFFVGQKPQPCVRVQWMVTSTRVKIGSQGVLLQSSTGVCQSAEQIPQGPPVIVNTQSRVRGI